MSVVNEGPVFRNAPNRPDHELNVGFRILSDYDVLTDQHLVRLDFKLNGVQVNAMMACRLVKDSVPIGSAELAMPRRLLGVSTVVHGGDLVGALRGLADRLEQELAKVHHA